MDFIDEAKIIVNSGDGGKGCVSFRREKFIPRGGPDGGDGGNGGDVVFIAKSAKNTLLDFRYKRKFAAKNGEHGRGKQQSGKAAKDFVISVPIGTLIKDLDTGEILVDMVTPEQCFVVAKGGMGGRGNQHFATSTNRAPRYAQPGTPGEERNLLLELKLLADIGLIGLPNVGKSTIISRISAAHPKIADYPFTTLIPNLGVVKCDDHEPFVVADVPGLIEGAHKGAGLGIRFLKHVERTKILVHCLDIMGLKKPDFLYDFKLINNELEKFSPALAQRRQIMVINKMDLIKKEEFDPDLEKILQTLKMPVCKISAITGAGIKELKYTMARMLDNKE